MLRVQAHYFNNTVQTINIHKPEGYRSFRLFCLPSEAGKPDLLKEEGITLIGGKIIRIARALLVTVGSEGSNRK